MPALSSYCWLTGEEGPPEFVAEVVDTLHVERVDHGVHTLDDPVLLQRLVKARMPFTVCPVSNLKVSLWDSPQRTVERSFRAFTAHSSL